MKFILLINDKMPNIDRDYAAMEVMDSKTNINIGTKQLIIG